MNTGLVTTAKDVFRVRLTQWQSSLSMEPSVKDLYTLIENSRWDDPMEWPLAARAQDSAESDSEFLLLKRLSEFCVPHKLASINLDKGLETFKFKAASVCYKVAKSRRQPLTELLSVTEEEEWLTEAINTQYVRYEEFIKHFHDVTLDATRAVADLEALQESLMKASC